MEYRGYKYQVVETSEPTKWRWTVDLGDEGTKTGSGYTRTAAVGFAQRCIDRSIDTVNVAPVSSQQRPTFQ
jgi:hypothetical protein